MLRAIVLFTIYLAAPPDFWPGFLGQGRAPLAAHRIPEKWSESENIAWKASIPGKGQSSPVIWGDRVYLTSIDGTMKDTCYLIALNLGDGSLAWVQQQESSQKVRSNYFQSRSAPTPVTDADGVYAFFETGNLLAFNHDGKPLWKRSLTDDYGAFESNIGLATSPLQLKDSIVLLIDHEGPSYLLSIDKKTGATIWKTSRDSRTSYSSPSLVPVGAQHHIVCSSAGSVDGYDPATGKLLWTTDTEIGGNRTATPLAVGDGKFVIAASPGMHNENEAAARTSNGLMSIESVGEGYQVKMDWRTQEAMPSYNTPLFHDGLAYWVNRAGVVFCFDAKTGEKKYANRIAQGCWATPIGIGSRIYIFGKDGLTTVLASGPEFRVLAENRLWDPETSGSESTARGKANGQDGASQRHDAGTASTGSSPDSVANSEGRSGRPSEAGVRKPARPSAEASAPQADATKRDEQEQQSADVGHRSSRSAEDRAKAREQGNNRFADPVQYGVAIVNGSIVVRTGSQVYCIREDAIKAATNP